MLEEYGRKPEKRLLTQAIRRVKIEKGDSENENVDGN